MKDNVDITLTDFVYAVVAGAAFQNVQPPLVAYSNALVLICFLVLVDDWVLYHSQAHLIKRNPKVFAACLALDLVVLLLWYGASVEARQGSVALTRFALMFLFFYFATAFWEAVFLARTKQRIRLVLDLACAFYFGLVAFLLSRGVVNPQSYWILGLLVPPVVLRIPIWRKLVLRST
jgi:hypothetical protein